MEKLFTDAETFTKVRPTKITEQQQQDFYKTIAEDISRIHPHNSGYEIAKDLEGYGSKANAEKLFVVGLKLKELKNT